MNSEHSYLKQKSDEKQVLKIHFRNGRNEVIELQLNNSKESKLCWIIKNDFSFWLLSIERFHIDKHLAIVIVSAPN